MVFKKIFSSFKATDRKAATATSAVGAHEAQAQVEAEATTSKGTDTTAQPKVPLKSQTRTVCNARATYPTPININHVHTA